VDSIYATEFTGQERIFLRVDKSILIDREIDYCNQNNCYLATALKKQMPELVNFFVATYTVTLGKYKYNIMGGMGRCGFLESFRDSRSMRTAPDFYLTIVLEFDSMVEN
jgi:hypothetical protein